MIDPSDWLTIDSWKRLGEELGLAYSETENALGLLVQGHPLVLSGKSDYTVADQQERHPNADLVLMAQAMDWRAALEERSCYAAVQIGPACREETCDAQHRYSLRTDRYTWQTFDEVPGNGTWYSTNVDVEHPRIRLLPYGLNTDGDGLSKLPNYVGRHKEQALYVNFQDNTLERILLKRGYQEGARHDVTVRPQVGLPYEEYCEDVATHQFVLCPPGCGIDSYRIWEALYLGSVPVLKDSVFARTLASWKLPVLVYPSLDNLEVRHLHRDWRKMVASGVFYDRARLSWWRSHLREVSEEAEGYNKALNAGGRE